MYKVLYLTDSLSNGGAERQLTLLVKYLPPEWEHRVWSLGGGPFADLICSGGVPVEVHKRRWRYDLVPILNLWQTLISCRPAIVHSWGWVCSAAVAPICRLLHIPLIDGSIRIGWVPREHKTRARLAFALANRVVANSQAGLDGWDIPSAKGRVIYNGFDPDRLPLTTRINHSYEPFTVVMAGRMSPVKDFASFLQAARIVLETNRKDSWRFLALGHGQQRGALMDSVADLVEKGVVAFPEAGLEVLPYVRDAQIGVLMTNPALGQEGCSNTILEYMACGLPVICSDSGGNREVVLDSETGYVIPPLDANSLANRIMELQDKPTLAAQMGIAGREYFSREFTVQNLVQKTISLYEELII